jgi:hypothetical protein
MRQSEFDKWLTTDPRENGDDCPIIEDNRPMCDCDEQPRPTCEVHGMDRLRNERDWLIVQVDEIQRLLTYVLGYIKEMPNKPTSKGE